MRILHLIKHSMHGHGNAHVAIDLACIQSQNGHSVVYASAGGSYDGLLDSQRVTRAAVLQSGSVFRLCGGLIALIRLCLKFKPDVIHAHMMSSAVLGYVASKVTGVPLVTTVHNSFDSHSILMRAGKIVVAVSNAERKLLLTRGFKPGQVVVILNGPNGSPRETYKCPDKIELTVPSITTLCGLHHRKGVHDLLRAFSKLALDFPTWHLNIIGDGPDRAKLEAQARELGITQGTHFLGEADIPKHLLQQSDIFVLASYAEPCSLALAEAREAGCAIVATAVGGTPELLAHGEAGLLVKPGHPEELAATLRKLLKDDGVLREWQLKAKTGAEFFNIHRVAREYDKVYSSLKRN